MWTVLARARTPAVPQRIANEFLHGLQIPEAIAKPLKRMPIPYRDVSSRLKRLLSEGRGIGGAPYRSDCENTSRHQLLDRATGKFQNGCI